MKKMLSLQHIRKHIIAHPARGFTLIETFVAILILMTALAGALSLASSGFNSSDIAGDQITASYLAQDGIEYIRWVRDSSCILGGGTTSCGAAWLGSLSACTDNNGNKSCYFDSSKGFNNLQPCNGLCPLMNFNSNTGFYNYDNANGQNIPTKFRRTVTIKTPSDNPGEADVTVTVSWTRPGGGPANVVLQEDMFNWQPQA